MNLLFVVTKKSPVIILFGANLNLLVITPVTVFISTTVDWNDVDIPELLTATNVVSFNAANPLEPTYPTGLGINLL